MKQDIEIYIDGACSGNRKGHGIGGWAAVHCDKNGRKKFVAGNRNKTTNNEMELSAAIGALKALRCPCNVTLFTDSIYLINCFAHSRAWLTDQNRVNRSFWLQFLQAMENGKHTVTFKKVAGHSGVALNETADKLAKEQVVKLRHELYD